MASVDRPRRRDGGGISVAQMTMQLTSARLEPQLTEAQEWSGLPAIPARANTWALNLSRISRAA